jgi:hypothetical protein
VIDIGTYTSLLAASNIIEMIDKIQNIKIGCNVVVSYKKDVLFFETNSTYEEN